MAEGMGLGSCQWKEAEDVGLNVPPPPSIAGAWSPGLLTAREGPASS